MTSDWFKCPSWDWNDPYRDQKTMCWYILIDAAKKSVMSNDLRDGGKTKSLSSWRRDAFAPREILRDMVRSREWILSKDKHKPGETIEDGVLAGIECHACLKALNIRKEVLFGLLGHLWLSRADDMEETMRSFLTTARAAMEHDKRHNASRRAAGKKAGRPRSTSRVLVNDIQTAMRAFKKTNKEMGV